MIEKLGEVECVFHGLSWEREVCLLFCMHSLLVILSVSGYFCNLWAGSIRCNYWNSCCINSNCSKTWNSLAWLVFCCSCRVFELNSSGNFFVTEVLILGFWLVVLPVVFVMVVLHIVVNEKNDVFHSLLHLLNYT